MSTADQISTEKVSGAAAIKRARLFFAGLIAALVIIFALSLLLGRYPSVGFMSIEQAQTDEMAHSIIVNSRLPRLIIAVLLGMTLAAAGTVMQMIFGNPLVDPGFLGVSQGAAFGAGLAIVCFGSLSLNSPIGFRLAVQGSSALFACLGLLSSCLIAYRIRFGSWILRLVLSGICVSAVFTSLLGIIKYAADPTSQLAEITFWMLGGADRVSWDEIPLIAGLVIVCMVILFLFRWRLNILALRDKTAFSLGAATNLERFALLIVTVISIAAVTAVCGLVSWVGLIVPHLSRKIFGADARFSLPGSMLLGALIVLLCDNICRTALPYEIPLGIATSLFGAFFFILLMTSGSAKVRKNG